jgi:hypothetical protein
MFIFKSKNERSIYHLGTEGRTCEAAWSPSSQKRKKGLSMYVINAGQHIAMEVLETFVFVSEPLALPTVHTERVCSLVPRKVSLDIRRPLWSRDAHAEGD